MLVEIFFRIIFSGGFNAAKKSTKVTSTIVCTEKTVLETEYCSINKCLKSLVLNEAQSQHRVRNFPESSYIGPVNIISFKPIFICRISACGVNSLHDFL